MDSAVPLGHQDNMEVINHFKKIVQSAFGPNGKHIMLQNSCGGQVTITSSASRLLKVLKVTNPVLKLVVSAAGSHLRCHENSGLTFMLVILELLGRSLQLQVPQCRVLVICRKLQQSVIAHLQECSLRLKVDFENLQGPLHVVRSIICSKPATYLTQKQRDHISHLLIRGFLNGIPKETTASNKFGNIHFLSHPGLSPDHSQLLDGMLIESIDSKLPDLSLTPLKCALFHVSLSGDVEGGITEETWHLGDGINIVESCAALILAMFKRLVSEEVAVVACQKVIHPRAKKYLQDHGVLVLDRLGLLSFGALTELTGANPIENFVMPLDPSGFGILDAVSITTLQKRVYYHLVNKSSNVSTLLLYNYLEESLEELKHVCHQGINALQELLQYPYIFCGGGCLEVHLAAYARHWGKENIQELMKTGTTLGQVISITEAFARSLESVGTSLVKDESEIFMVGDNSHLWYDLDNLANMKENPAENLHKCVCGAVTKTNPGIVIGPDIGSLKNTDSKWTESLLTESERSSLLVADGGLSKQNAIKAALETFITILNIDMIIKK